MRGILATNVAFSHYYPPLIYYLTERSLFKKCPPTGKSLKKALTHRILFKDLPTNLLPLTKLKLFKSIILFAGTPITAIGLSVCYVRCTLVPEALCEAKETRGENGEPLGTSGLDFSTFSHVGVFNRYSANSSRI
jgi:hypothetical protein